MWMLQAGQMDVAYDLQLNYLVHNRLTINVRNKQRKNGSGVHGIPHGHLQLNFSPLYKRAPRQSVPRAPLQRQVRLAPDIWTKAQRLGHPSPAQIDHEKLLLKTQTIFTQLGKVYECMGTKIMFNEWRLLCPFIAWYTNQSVVGLRHQHWVVKFKHGKTNIRWA
jgi:hypothetical protein